MTEAEGLRYKVLLIMLFEPALPEETRDWLWNFYHGDDDKRDSKDADMLGRVLNTLVAHVPASARWCHE